MLMASAAAVASSRREALDMAMPKGREGPREGGTEGGGEREDVGGGRRAMGRAARTGGKELLKTHSVPLGASDHPLIPSRPPSLPPS